MNNLPPFFIRRFDSHKFEKLMRQFMRSVYYESTSKKDFKYRLLHNTLDQYFHSKHQININDVKEDDVNSIIDYLIDIFGSLVDMYYINIRKKM